MTEISVEALLPQLLSELQSARQQQAQPVAQPPKPAAKAADAQPRRRPEPSEIHGLAQRLSKALGMEERRGAAERS